MADIKSKSVYDTETTSAEEAQVEYYPEPDSNEEVTSGVSDVPAQTRVRLTKFMSAWSHGKNANSVIRDKYARDANETVESLEENQFNLTSKYDSANRRIVSPKFASSNSEQFDSEFKSRDEGWNNANKPDNIEPRDFVNQETVEEISDQYVSTVLVQNRWTADNTRQQDGSVSIPRPLNERDQNSIVQNSEENRYTENQYTSIGATLAARASIEKGSGEDGYDVNSAASEIWGVLPGWSQLAVKRPSVSRFDAKDVLEKSGASDPDFISVNDVSWGTMNSPIDKYTGNTAIGMTALSIALMLGMLVGVELLATILGMIHNDEDEKKSTHGVFDKKGNVDSDTGIYDLGQFKPSATETSPGFPPLPLDLTAALGMVRTTNPWEECVRKGMLVFFGSDEDPGGFGSAALGAITGGDSFRMAAENPGFYIVFIRSVLRSSLVIFDQIKSAFGNLFSGDIFDGIKQLIELFEIIRSSKLMAALNLFAQLGDSALDDDDSLSLTVYDNKRAYSYVDSILNNSPRANISKSRLRHEIYSKNSTTLAWGAGQAGLTDVDGTPMGTTLLVPQTLYKSSAELGSTESWFSSYSSLADGSVRSKMQLVSTEKGTNRIPTEAVEKLESALDATYVPFYFHDIRTNEIISFNAFLTSLTDAYSPEWNKAQGYGRTDPVYTYKSTERKINMGFVVAATSDKDFKDMWIKINKLVTLVYPQYTEGTRIVTDDDSTSFIQPFSQMYSSSPLIRIRLGDLLRSNFSKFALARLFGVGSNQSDFKIKSESGEDVEMKVADYAKLEKTIYDSIESLRSKKDYQSKMFLVPNSAVDKIQFLKQKNGDPIDAVFMNGVQLLSANGDSIKVKITNIQNERAFIEIDDENPKYISGATGQISTGFLRVDRDEIAKDIRKQDAENLTKLNSLFSSENNAIVKSFKSTGGRGLAGVISDLTFDFFENVTWETGGEKGKNSSVGTQAPKMCRVSLVFSPIHDIAPGIDFMGYNRAPIYPIGHPYPRSNNDPKKGSD